MRVRWTSKALSDLLRLHEFLAVSNRPAAARAVKALTAAAGALAANPRIGERLAQFEPGEVRRLLVGQHELPYEIVPSEIVASDIVVLRLWHTREER